MTSHSEREHGINENDFQLHGGGAAPGRRKKGIDNDFQLHYAGFVSDENPEARGAMIICHCAGVTDCAIRMLIDAGASSVAEITQLTGAGECCPPCREEIATLLYSSSAASHNPV
jgi:bacterioferritin-associated ferredoxin